MTLSKVMFDAVQTIRRIERRKLVRKLDVPRDQLGNSLIEVYYETDSLRTRKLIMDFMNQAGVHWMRKLITKDTREFYDHDLSLFNCENYIRLIAANNHNTAHQRWA